MTLFLITYIKKLVANNEKEFIFKKYQNKLRTNKCDSQTWDRIFSVFQQFGLAQRPIKKTCLIFHNTPGKQKAGNVTSEQKFQLMNNSF